jgi:lambda family phage tail tape measure protein
MNKADTMIETSQITTSITTAATTVNTAITAQTTALSGALSAQTAAITGAITAAAATPDISVGVGGGGGSANALGNAFNAGNIIPYALGGLLNSIVNTPVYSPMAGNNTALIGEAGPEAVMPLTRDSSGRLGVQSKNDNAKIENKLKIVNVYDKEQMLAAMNTDKGEKMVMNILKKNGVI